MGGGSKIEYILGFLQHNYGRELGRENIAALSHPPRPKRERTKMSAPTPFPKST